MTEPIKLTLDFPPYTNNLYITLMLKGKPVRVPSGQAKKYKKAVEKICRSRSDIKPFAGELRLEMKFYRPRRIGDLDGTFKAVFDSLKGFAFEDDKQIVEIHAQRFDDKYNPRVEIEITEVTAVPQLFTEAQMPEEIPFS